MIKPRDVHIQHVSHQIEIGGILVGTLLVEYEIQAYKDLRNLSSGNAFLVTCRQRIIVPNADSTSGLAPHTILAFNDYPAILCCAVGPDAANSTPGMSWSLLDCHPKTLNTSVMTSQNASHAKDSSTMAQHSVGSTTSQTNSYEVSDNLGFFGDILTGGASTTAGFSSTVSHETSNTTGSTTGRDVQAGMSSSMSLKDWGVYAAIDSTNESLSWIWGQEYPWNVLDFHAKLASDPSQIDLPGFVQDRLVDGKGRVFPPSQLSRYGVNFVCMARWLVQEPTTAPSLACQLAFKHSVRYLTASHGLNNGTFYASINAAGTFAVKAPEALDLSLLGLDPIISSSPGNGAVIGFTTRKFVVPPGPDATFRIKSAANNLYATGTGFSAPQGNTGPLLATMSQDSPAVLTLQFKIVDATRDYSLILKHWKTTPAGCVLSLKVNGEAAGSLTQVVNAAEGEGGEGNLSTINLRNRNYASADYTDYLVLGLNTIEISIASSDPQQQAGYALRAVAIGEA